MRVIRALIVCSIVLATATSVGCSARTAETLPAAQPRAEATTTAGWSAVNGYAVVATNTPSDVVDARHAASKVLSEDIRPEMLRPGTSPERIPSDWWETHSIKPYKVVVLKATSSQDLAEHGTAWANSYIVVQERSDSGWYVFRAGEGY